MVMLKAAVFLLLAGVAGIRAQQNNLSFTIGAPQGFDFRYERQVGREAWGIRTGLLMTALWKYSYSEHNEFGPEITYAHPFRFGYRSYLKPGIGLGYHYLSYDHFPNGDWTNPALTPELASSVFLIPRMDYTVKYGWFKFSMEYGVQTGLFWSNRDGSGQPVPGRTFLDKFPLRHAVGISLGCFL